MSRRNDRRAFRGFDDDNWVDENDRSQGYDYDVVRQRGKSQKQERRRDKTRDRFKDLESRDED